MTLKDRLGMMFLTCFSLFLFSFPVEIRADGKEAEKEPAAETIAKEESVDRPFLRPVEVDESKSWATLGRLYVIIAADELLDDVPGKTAKSNGEAMEKLFRQNLATGAYAVIRIPADKLTRQTIFTVLSNLPLKPQDAVCLYFSGKGGYDRRKGSCFELSRGKEELYRSELRGALAKKGCRLDILISDFCDGYSLPLKPQPKDEASGKTDEVVETAEKNEEEKKDETEKEQEIKSMANESAESTTTSPLFFSLFFQTYGTVDIVGATLPMQQAFPTWQGVGCFTEAMDGLMRANRHKFLSWYRFFPYLANGTGLLFKDNYPDGAVLPGGLKQPIQTPMILTLGQDDYNPNVFAACYPQGKDFFRPVAGVSEDEIPLSDDDRKFITGLIQQAIGLVRPQNDREKGTHEDIASLDPDNTVNGFDNEAFTMVLPSLRANRVDVGRSDETNATRTPPSAPTTNPTASDSEKPATAQKKPRFGVAASANDGDGVKVTHVFDELPGKRAGLEIGDVILKIDGKQITTEKEYSDAIDAAGELMVLEVRNAKGGNIVTLRVRMRITE